MAEDNESRIQEIQREYLDFLDDDVGINVNIYIMINKYFHTTFYKFIYFS